MIKLGYIYVHTNIYIYIQIKVGYIYRYRYISSLICIEPKDGFSKAETYC